MTCTPENNFHKLPRDYYIPGIIECYKYKAHNTVIETDYIHPIHLLACRMCKLKLEGKI